MHKKKLLQRTILPERKDVFEEISPALLRERLEFETLLADMSTKFVNLPAAKIDQEIEHVLQRITEVLDIDRCSVAQFNDNRMKLKVTHAFAAPGVTPMPDITLNETQPWYSAKLFRCESIVVSSLNQLPPEAAVEKAYCMQQGIKSSALIPLAVEGSLLGVVGFAALKSERLWPDVLVQRLKLLGVVFANALMRKHAEQQLHKAFTEIKILKDRLEAENTYLREEISIQHLHSEFIGKTDATKIMLKQVEQVAVMDTTVLILGETGTGKELLAQEIHKLSQRKDRPMVTVNCAALPMNLIESELFGHEKGAYTGAEYKRIGRFELANNSTLFLDEIGETSLSIQTKLLRVLEERRFERLGCNDTLSCDVRVIAATNRDLLKAVRMGEFRMDLYYRLNIFPIFIPPLRDRRGDIPALVWFFVRSFCEKMGKRIENIPRTNMKDLCDYHWPGNVRELKNIIERALILTTDSTLQIDLPGNQGSINRQTRTLEEVQKEHIVSTLELTRWRIRGGNGAALILGLKPTTLESKIKKLGIERPASI